MFKDLLNSIDKKEWRLIIWFIVAIILLTTLPYVYGWLQTPDNYTYTGLHSLTPGDIHVYFSWMEQVKQGHFVSEDLYTSEPQARILLNSFWSVEGLIARYTGLSNNLVLQITRILLIPFFVILLYLISAFFWKDKMWRKISFIFLSFASGTGVAISIFLPEAVYTKGWYNWPLDMWASESNNLLTMFQSPHLILSTGLIILILGLTFLAFEKSKLSTTSWCLGKTKYSIMAGILALILLQFHPFHTPTLFGIMIVYFIVQFFINIKQLNIKKDYLFNIVKQATIIVLISLPSVLYWLYLGAYDFITLIRTYQNICLTPSLWVTVVSYGFIIWLALWAIYKLISQRQIDNKYIFLIVWLVVQFILLYSPFPFQRRLIQGLQIPMIILAVFGLQFIYNYLRQKLSAHNFNFYINNKYLALILFILLFTSSNINNWIREIAVFAETYPQLYVHNDSIAGYNWLQENTNIDSVILTDLYNGNLIPGRIGHKVYIGHGVETLFFESKLNEMVWFFATNNLDDKKIKFLQNNNINYIFYSSNEANIGEFNPVEKDYLKNVFTQGEVEIYQVVK